MPDSDLFAATVAAAHERGLFLNDTSPPTDRFCMVDGLRLHYLDWGTKGLPPMVLLHGFAVTAHAWDFFSLTARTSFHVYALDHRGHGESEWAPAGDYRRERHAADLVSFVHALDLSPLILIGHSLGGSVALLAATQMSERVQALVIVDSTFGPRHGPSAIQRFTQGPDTFPSLDAFADYAAGLNPRRTKAGLLRTLQFNARQLPDGQWTWKYDRILRSPDRPRTPPDFQTMWSALKMLPCPILYVRAGQASHLTDEFVPALESLAPRVRIVTVPDAAHSVMGDNPLVFEREVRGFFRDASIMS